MELGAIGRVGVVGAGLVGTGWAIVFARAGLDVVVYDADAKRRGAIKAEIDQSDAAMRPSRLATDVEPIMSRVTVVDRLEDAVGDSHYVQESTLERLPLKKEVSAEISAALRPGAYVGSSTSGFPASSFTAELANRSQFLVAHPVNPPHLVPVVEIVPAPWTDPDAVLWVRALMDRVGQTPVTVNHEIDGFILNRLQGALLDEAWRLFDAGYASSADIDATISRGLGLRWSFMGPFETIDLNAPLGIADYAARLGPMYRRLARTRPKNKPWSPDAVARATAERRAALPENKLEARRDWRDKKLAALIAHLRNKD